MKYEARRTPKRHSHCPLDLTKKAPLLDQHLKSLFDYGGIPFLGSEFASLAAFYLINFSITISKYAPEWAMLTSFSNSTAYSEDLGTT